MENTIWLSATSTAIKFFVPTYAVVGLSTSESESPVATLNKNGHITTQGSITLSGNLTAPNIYTNTEVDNLLAPKANTAYVDSGLAFKGNQSDMTSALGLEAKQVTTYTKIEVNNILAPKPTDTQLAVKANQSATYTKTEVDTALALKATQNHLHKRIGR